MRIILVLMVLGFLSYGFGQGRYVESRELFREALSEGSRIVMYFESLDLEVVKVDMDLVRLAQPKKTLKYLSSDYEYVIAAIGQPSRIADLDLVVYQLTDGGSYVKIDEDNDYDNNPMLKFRPPAEGTYLIVIKAVKMVKGFANSMGFYFLAVAHD